MSARPEPRVENELLAAALDYAARGWRVFHCKPRGKTPLTEHGFKEATTALATIRDWWARSPKANVAVATGEVSGFWVLDIDEREEVSGNATLRQLEKVYGRLPVTVEQRMPSGGAHLFFAVKGVRIGNSAAKIGAALDVRGTGGYVVVAPSVGINGRRYRWWRAAGPSQVPIADPPSWLLDALAEPKANTTAATKSALAKQYAEAALADEVARVAAAQKGTRNDTLNKASFALGQLVGAELLDRARVEAALFDVATARWQRAVLMACDQSAADARPLLVPLMYANRTHHQLVAWPRRARGAR